MAENTPIVDENTPEEVLPPSPSGYEAIDFEETYRAMNVGLQYVTETRAVFEHNGPQKWISDLATLLTSTAQKIREFELEHTDETVIWKDPQGVPHEVLVRLQDEKRFDAVMKQYSEAETRFNDYFAKHATLTQEQ